MEYKTCGDCPWYHDPETCRVCKQDQEQDKRQQDKRQQDQKTDHYGIYYIGKISKN